MTTDPLDTHGMTMDGEPAMPILVAEYNALITRVAALELESGLAHAAEREAKDELAAILSAPADRPAILREAAGVADKLLPTKDASWYDSLDDAWNEGTYAVAVELRRMADEAQQPDAERTPCSDPPCDDGPGEPCDRHETEQAHADGLHEDCGPTCEVAMPSEQMRNFILAKGYPGTAGMLDELLRRAAAGQLPAAVSQPGKEA